MNNKVILWIIPFIVLIILNVIAFLYEVFFARIDWGYALILRVSTIVTDGLFIGLYTHIRLTLRKKLKHKLSYKATIYVSETISVLSIFYSLYLARLAIFLYLGWINKDSFIVDSVGGFLVVILFGWLLAYITEKTKNIIKKRYKKGE